MDIKFVDHEKDRLTQLDGLRAVAIILVILNHIDFTPLILASPSFMTPVYGLLSNSGRTAVSFFMLLSGFLMAYYYPVIKSGVEFLQKRYTRIFPLFISLVITRFLFHTYPDLTFDRALLALFVPAILIHIIWVYGFKKANSKVLSRSLFWAFVVVQLTILAWYAFWIVRHPPIYFNQLMSLWIREGTITLVNATLTLPFGNYIPQLDGVYWSLTTEVSFYLLYPFLFIPIVQMVKDKSIMMKVLLIASLIPLLLGLDQLSHKLLGLSIIDIPFFAFFITGIIIASLYRSRPAFFDKISRSLRGPILAHLPTLVFLIIFGLIIMLFNIYPQYYALIRILSAVPIGILFLSILAGGNSLQKMLSSRLLVFIGSISFSMYLVHTSVIETVKTYFIPQSALQSILFIILIFILTIFLSYLTYLLLERPYFQRSHEESTKKSMSSTRPRHLWLGALVFGVVYIVCILIVYQSNYNFFSVEHKHLVVDVVSPRLFAGQSTITMDTNPKIDIVITAPDNNLGIISTSLSYKRTPGKSETGEHQVLTYAIREVGATDWYATSQFKPIEVGDSPQHPFGFPVIADSKGKKYEIMIELTSPRSPEYFEIDMTGGSVRSIYQVNKGEVLKNPVKLFTLIQNRLTNVLENRDAQKAIMYLVPFALMIAMILRKKAN